MFNPKRKADRLTMAQQLADAMLAAGAVSAKVEPAHPYHPRAVNVAVEAPGGAYIGIDIDGDLPDCIGGTWNTPQGVFLSPALGDVNPFHWGKLNVYCRDVEHLTWLLERHVAMLADGSGYLPHDDRRIVAMREHYAAQGWGDPTLPRANA